MAARQRHEALARSALSSSNTGQNRTLASDPKNRILLENYFLPGDLEAQIEAFVDHYNHQRFHESLNNVTPADVYFGRDKAILQQRPSRDIASQYPAGRWKGSNERHSKRAACITGNAPHNQTNQMSQTLS